jgi:tetratricopeptide (TPR) repeat protein
MLRVAMADDLGSRAAGLLVDQAWAALGEGRYPEAASAAARAVQAARHLDDMVLLVRALVAEGSALNLSADHAGALRRFTEILGLAHDPATSGRLDSGAAAEAVARAHWTWVSCARYVTSIPVRDLLGALDAADKWLIATGHSHWRAAALLERAGVHRDLGENDAAVGYAEEALAIALQHPDAPGYTLGGHRVQLGDILRAAGRGREGEPHYQAVLADPGSGAWERRIAHQGLAWCALAAGDQAEARREAQLAVQLAESLGDGALCTSLEALSAACRADGDLEAAWQAATRHLEAAGRIGGHYRPYYAARTAADIALDRGDLAAAREILADLDEHARAMDTATGLTAYTASAAQCHQRLAELGTRPLPVKACRRAPRLLTSVPTSMYALSRGRERATDRIRAGTALGARLHRHQPPSYPAPGRCGPGQHVPPLRREARAGPRGHRAYR